MTSSTQYRLQRSVIDVYEPVEKWQFELSEVSYVLSHLRRYLGRSEVTVLEHSGRVAARVMKAMEGRNWCGVAVERAMWHDGSEAFTGDIPGPVKSRLGSEFITFEYMLQDRIYTMAGCDDSTIIDAYGLEALATIKAAVSKADHEDYIQEQEDMKETIYGLA